MNISKVTRKVTIYRIKCKENGKSYIGRSSNLSARIKGHMSALRSNRHSSEIMQEDFNRYGAEAFEVSVLDIIPFSRIYLTPVDIVKPEKFYMGLYKTYDKEYGYNYKDPAFHPRRNHRKKG